MNSQLLAIAEKSLYSSSKCEEFESYWKSELLRFQENLSIEKNPTKREKIYKAIAHAELKLKEIKQLKVFTIGNWVKNGSTTPGKIIQLGFAGKIPEVHVQWWGSQVPVPERPLKLSIIPTEQMDYVWGQNKFPELLRRIDNHECDEIAVLIFNLDQVMKSHALAIENNCDKDVIRDYQLQITYCKKRLIWVNKQDLERFEYTIKKGLDVFYRVGEALMQIRDRKLYKDLGYSDFREYLRERWDMGKSRAYQLINSAEVVKNISNSKSVPHGGQNLPSTESVHHGGQNLPSSERITRELAKLSPLKQSEAWEKAVSNSEDGQPTATETKAIVDEIRNKVSIVQAKCLEEKLINSNKTLINNFEIGQLVKLQLKNFKGASERLKDANHSYGQITSLTETKCSFNLNIIGHDSFIVSPEDIQPVDSVHFPISFSPKQFVGLMSTYKTKAEIECAIKQTLFEN